MYKLLIKIRKTPNFSLKNMQNSVNYNFVKNKFKSQKISTIVLFVAIIFDFP